MREPIPATRRQRARRIGSCESPCYPPFMSRNSSVANAIRKPAHIIAVTDAVSPVRRRTFHNSPITKTSAPIAIGQEKHRERRRVETVTDDRSNECRAAGDQSCQTDLRPRRHDAADQRGGDAETFGGVVQPESDDQRECDGGCAGRGGGADRRAFAEVVCADADRDDRRENDSDCRRAARPVG